jgi:CubicO group peptidase (beta-lactamase class C family)
MIFFNSNFLIKYDLFVIFINKIKHLISININVNMKNTLLLFTILLLCSCKDNELQKFNVSSEKWVKELDRYSNSLIDQNELPGLVVMVKKGDKQIFHKSYGYSDEEKKIELDKNAIFRIASITKTITALGILKLMENGELNLDDEIEKYIPEFKSPKVLTYFDSKNYTYTTTPANRSITILDLLTHYSGVSYGRYTGNNKYNEMYNTYIKDSVVELYTTKKIFLKENITRLSRVPLVSHPGTSFEYGMSYDILGYIIEIVSGKSLNNFFNETFFIPLEMENTFFYIPEEKANLLIPVLSNKNGYWANYQAENYDINYPIKGAKSYYSGGAGLSGTISDYSNFLTMIVNKGKYKNKRVLKEETIQLMEKTSLRNITTKEKKLSHGIATGVKVKKNTRRKSSISQKEISILFWSGMFGCSYFINLEDGTIVLVFKQVYDLKNWIDYDEVYQDIIFDMLY